MLLSFLYAIFRGLISVRRASSARDLEIEVIVLRHQVKVLSRQAGRPKLRRLDRIFLAACSRVLPKSRWGSFVVTPSTLLRWHRELVKRKWTFKHKKAGRPSIDPKLAALIVRTAKQNSRWGYMRIKGELVKLGVQVSATTVKKVMMRAGLDPAPRRDGPTWSQFLRSQAEGIVACDFFTVETAFLRTLYVLFFIEVGSRRLRITTSTVAPDADFCIQQARNLSMAGDLEHARFLIRDGDTKFTRAFDDVFVSEGVRVIKTPVRSPKANAFAERLVRTVRHEVLDHTLILGRRHLDRTLGEYADHYNKARPHRGIGLRTPTGPRPGASEFIPPVRKRDVLGGLIHEYEAVAA